MLMTYLLLQRYFCHSFIATTEVLTGNITVILEENKEIYSNNTSTTTTTNNNGNNNNNEKKRKTETIRKFSGRQSNRKITTDWVSNYIAFYLSLLFVIFTFFLSFLLLFRLSNMDNKWKEIKSIWIKKKKKEFFFLFEIKQWQKFSSIFFFFCIFNKSY